MIMRWGWIAAAIGSLVGGFTALTRLSAYTCLARTTPSGEPPHCGLALADIVGMAFVVGATLALCSYSVYRAVRKTP
ncbi:hypothetical protein Dac01nite_03460 [Demequina activiva]|uniref:Uncharacterized protein n=1 Tax=Demequina activiva TaxID=1582364 RepID=A0A919Q0U5_9MICO|nr:hypothetical protein Dac01nite_03460 [Demequina activiva]